MANWAALQETLIAKPVVKRAKHGIHFQDGKQITAVFSGKPCHYFDGKLWKPIDTKLVARPDGWYGAEFSDILVHPDGRVKTGDYQQLTELPGNPTGKLNDEGIIVRSFAGGEQRLILTENGFREEIYIEKATFPIEKFIYSKSGALPSKYTARPITAVDADGKQAVLTADTMVSWLEKAKYPVTIDPDFAGGVADGLIRSTSQVLYADARNTSGTYDITSATMTLGQTTGFRVHRNYLLFDTSSIGTASTVTQVNLKMVVDSDVSDADFDIQIVKYDWSQWAGAPTNTTYRETAFDGCLAADLDDAIWRNTAGMSEDTQYASGNLSTAWVSKTGITYYGLRSSEDSANSEPTSNETVNIGTANHGTEGFRPVLTVLYSTGSKHFLSLLGVGK